MKIDKNSQNRFTEEFPGVSCVGFHGTSSLACKIIEQKGILPSKVFDSDTHQQLLDVASKLSLSAGSYCEWLGMRSVTFACDPAIAINHVKSGSSGGQGLLNMVELLKLVRESGSADEITFALDLLNRIGAIREAGSVVYAVDLTNLGPRLVPEGSLLQYYWNPSEELPPLSEISPNRLLARLDIE